MKVWIATWDVHNGGEGVEVFASQEMALDAVVAYAKEMSLLGSDREQEEVTRKQLAATGLLEFDSAECYYTVEEHDVKMAPG